MTRIRQQEIARLMRQLATLFSAGVSPLRCCDILMSAHTQPGIIKLLNRLRQDMLAGKPIHVSLSHESHLSPLICQLIRIGEQSGTLDHMLIRIADHLELRLKLKKSLLQSLFYPAFTLITASCITLIMLLFIIPRFADVFSAAAITLPLWTRWIFNVSYLLRHHASFLLLCPIVCYWLIPAHQLQQWSSAIMSNLPVLHRLHIQIALARFIRHLAITFSAGMPLPDAVDLCCTGPPALQAQLHQLRPRLLEGMPLHHIMQTLPAFPLLTVQLIKVGEESGKLDEILHRIANQEEEAIQQRVQSLCQLLEPLIILTLGVVIGGLVIGMYLPIFKLGNTL